MEDRFDTSNLFKTKYSLLTNLLFVRTLVQTALVFLLTGFNKRYRSGTLNNVKNVDDLTQQYVSKHDVIEALLSDNVKEIIKQKEEENEEKQKDEENTDDI